MSASGPTPRPTKAERTADAREKARRMREEAARRERRRRAAIISGVVVVVLALVVGIGVLIQQGRGGVDASAAGPTAVTEVGGLVVGAAAAPVQVRTYLDYQCPACRQFEEENAQYLAGLAEAGTITLEYVPVAILDRFSTTQYSTRSANAAFCAVEADQTRFAEVNAALFAAQPPEDTAGLTDAELTDILVGAGVPESVGSCVEDGTFSDFVATVTDRASQDGLQGTPTVMVDGEIVESSRAALQAAIEASAGA